MRNFEPRTAEAATTELSRIAEALRATPVSGRQELLGNLVATVGELAFMERLGGTISDIQLSEEEFGAALRSCPAEEIKAAAEAILALSPELGEDDDDARTMAEAEVLAALELRDRAELLVEGARHLLGKDPALPPELEAALLSFDELVAPELWRLLPLGQTRVDRVRWASPRNRARLWWWHRGSDLPMTALDEMGTTARTLFLFPEARRHLDDLIAAERDIQRFRAQRAGDPLVSIGELLERRRRQGSRGDPSDETIDALRIAAADFSPEVVLLETPELTVSASRTHFIVDLESPSGTAPDASATLAASGIGELSGTPTEPGRFEFPLSTELLRTTEVTLRMLVAGRVIAIRIPQDNG
jgi:hypothetical protein